MEAYEDKIIAPGQIIRDRYIPIENIPIVFGDLLDVDKVLDMINKKNIKYAEFMKPGSHRRTCHVDPLEICKFLNIPCDEKGIPL